MENKQIALAYALLQGFKKVELMPQQREHSNFKGCKIFIAYNKSIEDETTMIVIVQDGKAQTLKSKEEFEVISDIIFPPCI